MGVIAKFRVFEVTARTKPRETEVNGQPAREAQGSVKLSAIHANEKDPNASPEDIAFSLASPSGTIEISITNADALEQFQPGDDFYVRFEKAD